MEDKLVYEQPIIEMVELDLNQSIAASGFGSAFYEEIWGDK